MKVLAGGAGNRVFTKIGFPEFFPLPFGAEAGRAVPDWFHDEPQGFRSGVLMSHGKDKRQKFPELREQADELLRGLNEADASNLSPEQVRQLLHDLRVYQIELEKQNEELRRANASLERSNAELMQFAYLASDDLQEPLRDVVSCLQLLETYYKQKFDPNADKYIHYAIQSSVRIKDLIQSLLAYSRIEEGKPPEIVDCEQILEETLQRLFFVIAESHALITNDALPTITADDTQLSQVFQNLIQNAIKFRKDVLPQIHVSAAKDKEEWIFSIKDNGIGIESEDLDRIFGVFQRLHKRSEYDGSGMGLAIVKKIVERHGGRIWAESQPGKGTTFYFTIPDKVIQA